MKEVKEQGSKREYLKAFTAATVKISKCDFILLNRAELRVLKTVYNLTMNH